MVDALDEYGDEDGTRSQLLTELFDLQKQSSLFFFMTSRPHTDDIREGFKEKCSVEIIVKDPDVRRYVESHLHLLPKFIRKPPNYGMQS